MMFAGGLLSRLPLHRTLLLVAFVTVCFILWNLLFHHRKNSVRFVRPNDIVAKAAEHDTEPWKAGYKLMTCQLHGRLGNMMFAYAALVGIAWKSGHIPMLPENHFLQSAFHVTAEATPSRVSGTVKLQESRAGAYDSQFEQIKSNEELVELVGYFQSWRYFVDFEHQIRVEFTFRHHLTAAADKFLRSAVNENFGPDVHQHDIILIGIHVRVGDMTLDSNVERGYSIATPEYYTAAMELYRNMFPHSQLLYVLATDDRKWCKNNFPYKSSGKSPVVHTALGPDVQDLAILAACNHTIISVGSFGWWAGWLSSGMTVYYKDFPRPNSSLAHEYVLNDYYLDQWIAL